MMFNDSLINTTHINSDTQRISHSAHKLTLSVV